MKKIIIYICLISAFVLSAYTPTKKAVYEQCTKQIETINKMRLNVGYLVPVDSMGRYMNDEIIPNNMYHHCEVAASINHLQVHVFAILYFDNSGKVRKSIEWWSDGGDLRNVAYYDERGNLIYAVYDYYDNNCGKLYISGSQRYMEHPFSNSGNSREHLLPVSLPVLSTSEVASKYKTNLEMPDSCRTISFTPIQKGDKVYLCTNRIYTSPHKDKAKSKGVRWGVFAIIDSIAGDWCTVKMPTYEDFIGYVPIDSIELGIKRMD